ncbi:hypothetical protein GCM10025876_08700 [Demequina litorisediminis]|uniref:L-arabinose isomerase n=1 Tax=Demequina litorisediminis TaxID=1849022 RepID=A0ABQ6IBM8_9MICO|nr:hypothetical protein GCM10025876_08700 [Demequina litorisediminis]
MSARSVIPNLAEYEVWFLTGSQDLYGEETLKQVAEQSQQVAALLDGADAVPARIVWKPVVKSRDGIRAAMLEANANDKVIGVIAWMHTFSPAKMWITGLNVLDKPLLHLHTQANVDLPWGEIDFDFMNLNQAAHGDREFGYIETRMAIPRTTVSGHASHATTQERVGTWVRAAAGRHATQNMRVARFGDNMRFVAVTEGDKTEAEIKMGVQINTWSVNELAERVHAQADADIDALVAEYVETYDVDAELLPGGERAESLRYGAAVEPGPALLPRGGRLHGVHRLVRGPGRPAPGSPASPSSASWPMATASAPRATGRPPSWSVRQPSWVPAFPAARASWRTTRTTWSPATSLILGAHMLEVNPALSSKKARLTIAEARHRRQGGPGPPRLHGRRWPRRRGRDVRHARALPSGRQRGREREPPRAHAEACPWATRCGSPRPTSRRRRPHGSRRVPPTTR